MPDDKSKLVYSTGRVISRKEKPEEKTFPSNQRNVIVRLDRKARGGKSVTVIEGLQMHQKEKEALLRRLKASLGTGGTIKDTSLEIQGDHRDTLMPALEKMDFMPKRSGG